MANEICYWHFCFVPVETTSYIKIFGFAEFLAAVALLAVVYTITDVRYKFRIAVTPSPIYLSTFCLIATIGFQTLLTEIWLAEKWWVPKTAGLTPFIWQGIFGLLFLGTFLTWMYYAFIRPPVFGRHNANRFAQELYRYVLRGNDDELKVIANELARSAESLISYSRRVPSHSANNEKPKGTTEDYAHDILLLIANRKLCRQIVASSPVTAQAFFDEMSKANKFDIPIGQFARNISSEAIAQNGSFIYGEAEGYESGLLGYLKPVSQAVYGNYLLVESLASKHVSPLDIHYAEQLTWDASKWEAYCRATLVLLESYLSQGHSNHSYALFHAVQEIEHAFRNLSKLNDASDDAYDRDEYKRLDVVADFINKAIDLLDKQPSPPRPLPRVREGTYSRNINIYDYLAQLIFKMCFEAATIKSPPGLCWSIYYNVVWSSVYRGASDGFAWKVMRAKVRRLLYDKIKKLSTLPNYEGSRILGFCLNVLGLNAGESKQNYGRDTYALAKAVQRWTRKNYLSVRMKNPDVAASVLIGRVSFDESGNRLVMTYFKGLSREEPKVYLELESPT